MHCFSKIVVSTVVDDRVTRQDTVLKDADYYQPTFNIDGTSFAYYKSNAGLCLYDMANRSSRVLVKLNDWPQSDREQHILRPRLKK